MCALVFGPFISVTHFPHARICISLNYVGFVGEEVELRCLANNEQAFFAKNFLTCPRKKMTFLFHRQGGHKFRLLHHLRATLPCPSNSHTSKPPSHFCTSFHTLSCSPLIFFPHSAFHCKLCKDENVARLLRWSFSDDELDSGMITVVYIESEGEQCVCLTKFLQAFHFRHTKWKKKKKVNWHAQFRSWHVLWLVKKIKHTSIDTLEIEMTHITRQLKYYKLQLKYRENITHNNRRTPYTHLHT